MFSLEKIACKVLSTYELIYCDKKHYSLSNWSF